jgi:alkylated DNA repair dioxygenase AlkB
MMDLFDEPLENPIRLQMQDGDVSYYGALVSWHEADLAFNQLLDEIEWEHDQAVVFGKHIVTRRKVAWYGEKPFSYTYSNTTKRALPWTEQLRNLKYQVEQKTGETFNSCLLNLYHDGSEGMAWHSDAEVDLKKNGAIASLSFGAERKFSFKHKQTREVVSVTLQHGSLLLMKGSTQTYWQHRLPPTRKILEPRINLTFRTIIKG